jgi:hypothetical protein
MDNVRLCARAVNYQFGLQSGALNCSGLDGRRD